MFMKSVLLKIYRNIVIKRLERRKLCTICSSNIPISVLKNNIGYQCYIGKDVSIYKKEASIGDYTYINSGKIFYGKIGKFCSIGYHVCIGSGEHFLDRVSTFPVKRKIGITADELADFPEQKAAIIENDVWIGNNVIIKQGVKVGNGAVLASGAVVTKDVEPYSIVGGVPAKLIRFRFNREVIDKLERVRWWDWNPTVLKEAVAHNRFDDVEAFLKQYAI